MNADDELYDQLEKAMGEASNSRREAFEESVRRRKAERDAIEAIRRAKAAERSYSELEKKLKEQDEIMQQVQSAMESQISESDQKVKELEKERDKLQVMLSIANMLLTEGLRPQNQASSTMSLPRSLPELSPLTLKERDDLQIEANILTAEGLRQQNQASGSTTYLPQLISEFSFAEIEEERDDLQIESSIANMVTAEDLRQQNQASRSSSSSTTYLPQLISEFSFSEIEEERDDLQIESSIANTLTAEDLRQQNQASRATYLPQYISEFWGYKMLARFWARHP